MYIGPAFRDTINHAAPTLCIKAPTSEKTLAISKSRKVFPRSGRHALAVVLECWSPTNRWGSGGSIEKSCIDSLSFGYHWRFISPHILTSFNDRAGHLLPGRALTLSSFA